MTWLDPAKYEHVPITSATGPGTMYDGYAWKFVDHSTEGPPGSIAGTISLFKSRPASCPHLMIDPMGTGRRVQHIPLNWSACALKGGAGGWQTNRGRAIQMEICGYAAQAQDWPDDALWQIADVIADVIKAGYPINLDNVPDDSLLRGTLATTSAPQRMAWQTWKTFDGISAHVRVPNNDHWDTGRINSQRLAQIVREILAGQGRPFVPKPVGPLPPAPVAPRDGYMSKGMIGGQVTFLQDLLIGLGYNVGVHGADGVFGFGTEQAVMAFQRDKGLDVDGIVGPATTAAISAAYASVSSKPPLPAPAPPSAGYPGWPGRYLVLTSPLMQGNDVRTWQQQMANRGWRLGVDGFYGQESFSICKTFQHEKGLTVDGIVGRQTWDAAWSAPVT